MVLPRFFRARFPTQRPSEPPGGDGRQKNGLLRRSPQKDRMVFSSRRRRISTARRTPFLKSSREAIP